MDILKEEIEESFEGFLGYRPSLSSDPSPYDFLLDELALDYLTHINIDENQVHELINKFQFFFLDKLWEKKGVAWWFFEYGGKLVALDIDIGGVTYVYNSTKHWGSSGGAHYRALASLR